MPFVPSSFLLLLVRHLLLVAMHLFLHVMISDLFSGAEFRVGSPPISWTLSPTARRVSHILFQASCCGSRLFSEQAPQPLLVHGVTAPDVSRFVHGLDELVSNLNKRSLVLGNQELAVVLCNGNNNIYIYIFFSG